MTKRPMIDPSEEWLAEYDFHYLPATIEEGLDARLLDRRWRPRDDRGRFRSPIEKRLNLATRD